MDILVNPLYEVWTNFNNKGNPDDRYKSLQVELAKNRAIWQSLSDTPPAESKNASEGSGAQKRVPHPTFPFFYSLF